MSPLELIGAAHGHLWTLVPGVVERVRRPHEPGVPWSARLDDPRVGPVTLTGLLDEVPGSAAIVVVVHGLGGHPQRGYCIAAARAARAAGLSSLRLAVRGADRRGEDFHHAGLTADLAAALASAPVRRYPRVLLLGYSLGGHLALAAAVEQVDPRLAAVAAVCPPLELAAVQRTFDVPGRWLYRRHMLAGLNEIYRSIARRHPERLPTPVAVVERATTIREWDSLTVCPRFGFADPDDYYRRASVGARLGTLTVPALVVAATHDPVIPASTVRAAAAAASPALEVRFRDLGGHLSFFPARLEAELVRWLLARSGAGGAAATAAASG